MNKKLKIEALCEIDDDALCNAATYQHSSKEHTLSAMLSQTACIEADDLTIRRATVEELMTCWQLLKNQNKELVTCRPVKLQSSDVARCFYEHNARAGTTVYFVIYWRGELAGRVSLNDYNPRNASAELGYNTLPSHRWRGVMTRALSVLLSAIFNGTDLHKIYAQTGAFNTASVKLLEKLSFSRDACLRDHHVVAGQYYDDYIYSLIRTDVLTGL